MEFEKQSLEDPIVLDLTELNPICGQTINPFPSLACLETARTYEPPRSFRNGSDPGDISLDRRPRRDAHLQRGGLSSQQESRSTLAGRKLSRRECPAVGDRFSVAR